MSTFRIGQRVRIICPISKHEGREATIISELVRAYFSHLHISADCYGVDVDGYGRFDSEGEELAFEPDELEPIIDDGRKVVEWSECLWKPEGVSA